MHQVALNRSLRKKARKLKFMSEVAYKSVVVNYFNLVHISYIPAPLPSSDAARPLAMVRMVGVGQATAKGRRLLAGRGQS